MTNPQLIDFIKQQLQEGLTKEKISGELLANGWNSQDVEEGFAAVDIPPTPVQAPVSAKIPSFIINPNISSSVNSVIGGINRTPPSVLKMEKHSPGKAIFITLTILLLLIAAAAYIFRDDLLNLPVVKDLLAIPDTAPLQNNVEIPVTPQPEIPAPVSEIPVVTPPVTPIVQPEITVPDILSTGYRVTDPYSDLAQCSSLTGDKLHLCYMEVVAATKDDATCEKLPTEDDKNACYAWAALVKNNLSLCDKSGSAASSCKIIALLSFPNTDPKNCNGTDTKAKALCISAANALQKVMTLAADRASKNKLPELSLTMIPSSPTAGQDITIVAGVTGLVTGEKIANINFMVLGANPTVVDKAPYQATFKIAADATGEQMYPVNLLTNTGIYIMKNIVFNLK